MNIPHIPRMRSCPEIICELKEIDPHTALTVSGLRRLIKEGKLKSVKVGNRNLVNFDQLLDYLATPLQEEELEEAPQQKVSHIGIDRIETYKRNIGMIK